MIIIAVLFIFHYMGMEELQKKAAAAQRLSIQQQNAYIGTLEGMQEEMRRFRHDYKNMMAGMYLQAKEGNLSEITEFIQKMTDDFEDQVGGQIQKMTQLRNVCIMEVRGILLVKFMEMEQEGISCELEVIAPLQEANIKTTDLCRCLGILIDNAIDEVRGHDGAPDHSKRQSAGNGSGKVHVMISRQEDCVTIRVKNTLYHEIDLSKIWESGYSTKGKERGIGLTSYKRILDGYDNIVADDDLVAHGPVAVLGTGIETAEYSRQNTDEQGAAEESTAPPRSRSTLLSIPALALTTITGIPWILGSTASPLSPGSIRSSKIRSGFDRDKTSKASVPE